MSTGISISDAAAARYTTWQKGSDPSKFLLFKIENDKEIVVEKEGEATSTFSEFVSYLPENEGRYALYKMDFTTTDGRPSNKIVLITWSPDNAPVKKRMMYAGSAAAVTRLADGISVKVIATDSSELSEKIVTDACNKK